MRGREDEWMDDGAVYVTALALWLSPHDYLDYLAATVASLNSTEGMEEDPPWP